MSDGWYWLTNTCFISIIANNCPQREKNTDYPKSSEFGTTSKPTVSLSAIAWNSATSPSNVHGHYSAFKKKSISHWEKWRNNPSECKAFASLRQLYYSISEKTCCYFWLYRRKVLFLWRIIKAPPFFLEWTWPSEDGFFIITTNTMKITKVLMHKNEHRFRDAFMPDVVTDGTKRLSRYLMGGN